MQRTGDTFDNWQIIALKTLWYDPMHCEDRIRDEERASIDYYRSIGTPLLNHNSPIDTNDNRRTYMDAPRQDIANCSSTVGRHGGAERGGGG